MTLFRPTGSKVYYFDFQIKKVRYTGSTGETEQRLARRFEKNEKEQVRRQLSNGAAKVAMTFAEAVGSYVDSADRTGKSAIEEEKHFDRLIEWIGEDTPLNQITNETVDNVVVKRAAMFRRDDPKLGKLSPAMVNRSSLDLLKRVLLRARDTLNQPVQGINWKAHRRKEAGPRTREISLTEDDAIEPHLKDGYGDAYQLGVLTGFRLDNLVSLTWPQISFEDRTITVQQKGDRPHVIRIDSGMMAILRAQVGNDPVHVFMYKARATTRNPKTGREYVRGKSYPLTVWGFASFFRRLKGKAEITDIRPHDMRRTAGGRMLRGTNNLKATQQLLGHSSIATTARHYAHLVGDDMLALQEQALAATASRRRKYQGIPKTPEPSSG